MTSGGTLVLLYHRVAGLDCDPHRFAVRPDRFAQHCAILRQRCEVVPLREATGSRRQVTITFDDGYVDNGGEARRILVAAGLPATFFITVGRLGHEVEAWWDRLARVLLEARTTADAIDVTVGGRRLWADIRSTAARERAHMALYWRLRPLRPSAIEPVLAELHSQLGVRPCERETHRWMTVEELRGLAESDGMDIGAHTVTHPFLTTLTAEEQRAEIKGSRDQLERLLGKRISAFSYPYGGPDAFNADTITLVRDAGYTMACTATGGLASPGCDPFQIPRNVVGDWDGDGFNQWLDRWQTQP